MLTEMRTCRVCGKTKPLSQYPRVGRWWQRQCYTCQGAYWREWRRLRKIDLGLEFDDKIISAEQRALRVPVYAAAVERGEPIPFMVGHGDEMEIASD